MERDAFESQTNTAERIRQYAEVALIVATYDETGPSAPLTRSETRATVSAGPEVEPHKQLTTQ
jgi:hypothetical protein